MIVELFWWFVFFPCLWLLATPFILILSLWGEGAYVESVKDKYQSVTEFWDKWGLIIMP